MSYESHNDSSDSETGFEKSAKLGEGFDSDSEVPLSDDSSDEDSSRQKDEQQVKLESNGASNIDDDDMFASDSEDDPYPVGKHHLSNIEKFEKENELENRQHASIPRGEIQEEVGIEEFNIRREVESGVLDENLRYKQINESDDDEPWMNELSKSDIIKAKRAHERQSLLKIQKSDDRSKDNLIENLIKLLEPSETPYESLSRLRPKKVLKKTEINHEQDQQRKMKVFKITEICEQLINAHAISQIYELSREQLMRAYKRTTGKEVVTRGVKRTAEEAEVECKGEEVAKIYDSEEEEDPKVWEFRWIGETDINGPYSSYEMKYWEANYFEERVEARKVGLDEFIHISKLNFDAIQ